MNSVRKPLMFAGLTLGLAAVMGVHAEDAQQQSASDDASVIERGRYVVATSGCNDCHTPGYPQSGGKVPVEDWLIGDSVGFRGPWGVSYPANLRLSIDRLTEAQWIAMARGERLPPMPWFSLVDMTDDDLRAIYAFVRALGPKGEPAPLALRPGEPVSTPVFDFVPRMPDAPVTAPAAAADRIAVSDASR